MTAQQPELQNAITRLTEISALTEEGTPLEIRSTLASICGLAGPQTASVAAELLELPNSEFETDRRLKTGLLRLQETFQRESLPSEELTNPPGGGTSPVSCALEEDPELIGDFVVEAREHLAGAETHLLVLEKDPTLLDAVHSVFRSFHTIKGLAGFLALGPVQAVAHETETILHHAREGRIDITPQIIDLTLKAADFIRLALDALSSNPPQKAMASLPPHGELLRDIAAVGVPPDAMTGKVTAPLDAAPARTGAKSEMGSGDSAVANSSNEDYTATKSAESKKSDASVVRVDTSKLEYLIEMVGELVIAQSLIHFGPAGAQGSSPGLSRNFAQLGRVTGEIQKTVLSMRMVPISRLYDRMARLVRDLGRKSGKSIELRRIGDHVELDRNIVEEITDPFVHMIRNSVDHGIEDTETRRACGKEETAFVTLEAFHQAGYIILRLSDDGRGLRADKILEKAIQRGLISPESCPDERAIYRLIFEPGFSTAERVTEISGRGVGMDVVRRQIEKLRGTIEITSTPGVGCVFTLKLPLTLAMVDGLILESGGERYVLPIYSVREMFHLTAERLFTVESRAEMVLLRGSLLPVVRLDSFFANTTRSEGLGEIGIVVEGRTRQLCLVVDRMLGKQEVVIKALGPCFTNVKGVAGGAILGDGKVGLILDVHGIDGGDASEI